MNRIAFIIPYFGQFPEWTEIYFETIRRNPSIDFHFFTDVLYSQPLPPNVLLHSISFSEYVKHANRFLDFEFDPPDAYKLCDLRPLFGIIHKELLEKYDFYGWTDMDILFGDIRKFYTDKILNKYQILSTHSHTISGHMALFRNTEIHRNYYKKIYRWREALQNPQFIGIDEHGITNAYLYSFWEKAYYKYGLRSPKSLRDAVRRFKARNMYLVEQYTTPFVKRPWLDGTMNSHQPNIWFYKNGRITNNRDKDREFIYLHFMNFKSDKWRHDGTPAPWKNLKNVCNAKVEDMATGICIDPSGINPI